MARGRAAGSSKRKPGMKVLCNCCALILPSECFRTRTVGGHVYLRSTCRNCEQSSLGQKKAIRAWQQAHPEKTKAARTKFRTEQPDRAQSHHKKWRAAKRGVAATLTHEDWLEMKATGACHYCKRTDLPLTQDHVLPLSRGGSHTKDNVVPACKPCNSSKRDKTPDEWAIWKTELN